MATQVSNKCEEEGCNREGLDCYLPDNPVFDPDTPPGEAEPDHYVCGVHAQAHGFCWACGMFWGGIESFDFGRTGLCENCLSTGDFEDEEDDMDAVYSTYPFDSEYDWHKDVYTHSEDDE